MRRETGTMLLAGLGLALTVSASAAEPLLDAGAYVYAGAYPLNVGASSRPFVVDWNNDTKKDLVVGTDEGMVRLYLNQGTGTDALFADFSYVRSGGSEITLPGG